MGIPESHLETWAKQGSVTQSSTTYATIKRALEARDAGYANQLFEVFLQGSYGNDTNIYAESDVDVVIRLDSVYYYDITALTADDQARFNAALIPGGYPYSDYKADVVAALTKSFGTAVVPGAKAIKIQADGGRRNADVIVATEFKRYRKFPPSASDVDIGICFFTTGGDRIANYPEQHSTSCTRKHQGTNNRFKPMVRVLKNMRSRLVTNGLLDAGVAPSYYLEGLLYNVPAEKFEATYGGTFIEAINWIAQADRRKFVCASEEYYLFGSSAVQWTVANCDLFLNKVIELWNNWT